VSYRSFMVRGLKLLSGSFLSSFVDCLCYSYIMCYSWSLWSHCYWAF